MDLRMDIGLEKTAEFVEAMERIETLAKKYNMPLAGVALEGRLTEMYKTGYRLVLLGGAVDIWVLAGGIQKAMKNNRADVEIAKMVLFGEGKANGHENGHENGNGIANGH